MKYVYVDNEIGDDKTGNGSKKKPYKTLEQATWELNKNCKWINLHRDGYGVYLYDAN